MCTIVFDLDGTLIDTAPDLIHTLNLVLTQEGLPAIRYAEDGFVIQQRVGWDWQRCVPRVAGDPHSAATYLSGGQAPLIGSVFRLPVWPAMVSIWKPASAAFGSLQRLGAGAPETA